MTTVLGLSPFWTVALASLVGVLAAGRLTKLVVEDKFPPMVWLRGWYDSKTNYSDDNPGWGLLLHCPWCFGFWAALIMTASAYFSNLHPVWWFVCVPLAAAYVVSWIVFHDED